MSTCIQLELQSNRQPVSGTQMCVIIDSQRVSCNSYENTIAGQFYGHTHYDEFIVFYDEIDRQRAVSMVDVVPDPRRSHSDIL